MNNLGTRNSELETLKIIAVIPARYAASRFPGKLMQNLGDKTVIATTYQNVLETQLLLVVLVSAPKLQRVLIALSFYQSL